MHRLSYSSRGSIVIECAIPAVQTTVELCRTKIVLLGSGGPADCKCCTLRSKGQQSSRSDDQISLARL
jgi:hypothetical protein